jgi:hypothetical protein
MLLAYWLLGTVHGHHIFSTIPPLKTRRHTVVYIFRNDLLTFSKPDQFLSLRIFVQYEVEYIYTLSKAFRKIQAET